METLNNLLIYIGIALSFPVIALFIFVFRDCRRRNKDDFPPLGIYYGTKQYKFGMKNLWTIALVLSFIISWFDESDYHFEGGKDGFEAVTYAIPSPFITYQVYKNGEQKSSTIIKGHFPWQFLIIVGLYQYLVRKWPESKKEG
jgi:hypothetical protein